MKRTITAAIAAIITISSFAQEHGDIYGERKDSLKATVFVSRQNGNYLSKGKDIRTEVISTAGLHKMACCSLAESFENSASVTVGYSDAVTGARQIRLLGLSGVYTQMLDENRPIMRGLTAPFGLSYVPGQWLESIQIAKGVTSVTNGSEAMTGQINLEHRKPTDEKPLFVNASYMNDSKTDFNIASSVQFNEAWSTVLMGHVSGNFMSHDMNGDGFMDDPRQLQMNFSNRWLYFSQSGLQVRFGVKALQDRRNGGMMPNVVAASPTPWTSDITNSYANAYVKVGVPLNADNSQNIAFVTDVTYQKSDDGFGKRFYNADQKSLFANVLYLNEVDESNKLTAGLSTNWDAYNEMVSFHGVAQGTTLGNAGAFAEYTFHKGEEFSAILGLRGDWYNGAGFRMTPRVTLKYAPVEALVLRANAGRGLRRSTPLVDNIGVFSTSKAIMGSYTDHILEDAWTMGANATWYLPFATNAYISLDWFHTRFAQQMVVDYDLEPQTINFYSLDGRQSYTTNYQVDFNIEPVERFTVTLTGRYTDAKMEFMSTGLVEKPLTSRFKGVLNLQYATNLNKWIFDFTASANGSCRVYDFMKDLRDDEGNLLYEGGRTPVYPLLYAQVTKRFKGFDVYLGAENITGFRQKNLLIGTVDPATGFVDTSASDFDASAVWGPIMGSKVYLGFRWTIWK